MEKKSNRNQVIKAISDQYLDQSKSKNKVNEVFLAQSEQSELQRVFVVFKQFNNYLTQAIEKIYNEQMEGKFKYIIRVENYFTSDSQGKQYYFVELKQADKNLSEFYKELSKKKKKEQENLKLQIMIQVTKGLQELHSKKIIHRDIKPENILMIGENAFIGDLGLIKVLSKDDPPSRINSQGYSAPELYTTGQNYTFSVDVYSLGRLFLYILFGEPNEKALIKHKQENSEIGKLIREMIEEKPNKRPKLNTLLNKLQELNETEKFEEPDLKKLVKTQ